MRHHNTTSVVEHAWQGIYLSLIRPVAKKEVASKEKTSNNNNNSNVPII